MKPTTPSSPRRACRAGLWLLLAALTGCAAAPTGESGVRATVGSAATESAEAARSAAFARWVADFSDDARRQGIDEGTLRAAFAPVRYLPAVVERDGAQPEFTRTVWDYLDLVLSPQRVTSGQDELARQHAATAEAAARYGVPAAILIAIWGLESDYGNQTGDVPTIDALATLGFAGRRGAWARAELLAALRILQSGDIDRAHMVGSWAGAMGQTQFLPSNFLAQAVDADGDGRRDIWGSMADVFASTANMLASAGWRTDEPWGVEVRLPAGFDLARADAALRQPSARWADEGVRTADGAPLPAIGDGAILLPAGARGPAFLVGANFRALLRYNNATSYALAVGLLAQRVDGGPGVQASWPRDLQPLTRSELAALQKALNERGFDAGPADGILGPATRGGVRAYQRSAGLPADGYPTLELLQRLQLP